MNSQDTGSPPIPGRLPLYFLVDFACSHAARLVPALGEIEQILRFARNAYDDSAAKTAPERLYFSVIGFGAQAFQAFPVCPSRDAEKVLTVAAIDAFPLSARSSLSAALALLAQSKGSELHNVGLAGDAHPIVYVFTGMSAGEVTRLLMQQSGTLVDCERIVVIGAQGTATVNAGGLPECDFIAPEQLLAHLEGDIKPLIEQHQRDHGTHSFYRPQVCPSPLDDLQRLPPGQENALSEPWTVFLSVLSGTQATIKVVAKVPGVIRWRLNIGSLAGSQEISAGGEVAIPFAVPQGIADRTLLRGEVALFRDKSLVGLIPIIGLVLRSPVVALEPSASASAPATAFRKKRALRALAVVAIAVLGGVLAKAFFVTPPPKFDLTIVPESPANLTIPWPTGEVFKDPLRFKVTWGQLTADARLDVRIVFKAQGDNEQGSSVELPSKPITLSRSQHSFEVEYTRPDSKPDGPKVDVEGEVTITCPNESISLDAPPFKFQRHIISDK